MLASDYYLHYWFYNSELEIQDFEAQKQKAIQTELKHFRSKTTLKSKLSAATKQVKEMLGLTEEKNLDTILANALNVTTGTQSGIGNLSIMQASRLNTDDDAIASTIMRDLSKSSTSLQNAVTQLMQGINVVYPKAVDYALHAVAERGESISSYEVLQQLLGTREQIISIGSNSNLTSTEQQIVQQYAKIQAAISIIPNLGNMDVSGLTYKTGRISLSRNVNSQSELLTILLGKIGGNISYLHRLLQQAANARAEKVAEKKISQEIKKKLPKNNGVIAQGPSMTVTKTVSGVASDGKDINTKPYSQSGGNYSFVLTDNRAEIAIQGNVPAIQSYRQNLSISSSKIMNYKINLYLNRILQQTHINRYYYESVATGMQEGTPGSLQEAWRSIVDYAVTLGVLDYLRANANETNQQYMVMGDHLVSIGNLISEAIDNPDVITYAGGKQRAQFWKINQRNWQGKVGVRNPYFAQMRSRLVKNDLTAAFSQTSIQAKINLTLLGI